MSRRSPRVPACALALALLAGAALPAAAQEPGATATFGDETAVTLVELPVEVTRDGAAVGGLTAGDFVVTERGRELPVVSFEEVTLGAGGGEASPAMPSLAARRHVFLLFDLAFSRPERVRRGVAEARDFVGRLDPSDVVAVGVYSPGGELAILSSFSGDHRASLRTLDTLAAALDARPAAGAAGAAPGDPLRLTGTGAEHLLAAAWPIDERNISGEALAGLGQPARTFSSGNSVSHKATRLGDFLTANLLNHGRMAQAPHVLERLRGHVRGMSETLGMLAETLRGVQGRKVLAFFSEGFAGHLLTAKPGHVEDATFGGSNTLAVIQESMTELRRAGWKLHAVDLAGAVAQSVGAEGLLFLASETGGSLVERTNDFAAGLERAMAPSRHVYLLHVQPQGVQADGSFHPLEVKVRDAPRGTRVDHRDGYHAPLPFHERPAVARLAEAATLIAAGTPRDDLGVAVVATTLRASGATTRVGVAVEVPGHALQLGGGAPTGLEVYGYAVDAAGAFADFFSYAIDLDPRQLGDRLASGGVRFVAALDLAPKPHELRLLVRERARGEWSLLAVPLRLDPAAAPEVSALFLPTTGDPWLVAREPGEEGFQLHGRAVAPAVRPALPGSGDSQLLLVGHGLAGGGMAVRSRVLDAAGKLAAGAELQVLGLTPGGGGEPDVAVARLHTAALPPGAYQLEVVLAADGVARSAATTPFVVAAAR